MSLAPPRLRVEPADEARLAAQARSLAGGGAGEAAAAQAAAQEVVTFTLGGQRCAVATRAVARAVARLGPTTEVPRSGGGLRPVAWVDEQPVAVTDLAPLAGLAPRPPAALALAPALLLAREGGLVALAVEGPLELAEAALEAAAGPALEGLPGLGLAGRLQGGALLLADAWVLAAGGGAP